MSNYTPSRPQGQLRPSQHRYKLCESPERPDKNGPAGARDHWVDECRAQLTCIGCNGRDHTQLATSDTLGFLTDQEGSNARRDVPTAWLEAMRPSIASGSLLVPPTPKKGLQYRKPAPRHSSSPYGPSSASACCPSPSGSWLSPPSSTLPRRPSEPLPPFQSSDRAVRSSDYQSPPSGTRSQASDSHRLVSTLVRSLGLRLLGTLEVELTPELLHAYVDQDSASAIQPTTPSDPQPPTFISTTPPSGRLRYPGKILKIIMAYSAGSLTILSSFATKGAI